jgi:hypothetical protein
MFHLVVESDPIRAESLSLNVILRKLRAVGDLVVLGGLRTVKLIRVVLKVDEVLRSTKWIFPVLKVNPADI